MAILKYKMTDGWKILYNEFFQKVIRICNQALQRNKNLSDLDNVEEARNNLGLDQIYLRKDNAEMSGPFKFADNTWNPVGNDVYIGDRNKSGELAIKSQASNKDTGIALVRCDSADENDVANIKYERAVNTTNEYKKYPERITFDKPVYLSEGIISEYVTEASLDDYHKAGFFHGVGSSSSDILPLTGTGNDFAGILLGYWNPDRSDQAKPNEQAQIVFDSGHVYFREWDVPDTGWTNWEEFAFKKDIDAAVSSLNTFAKIDATNINAATWNQKLAVGAVESGNKNAVSGNTVYNAIENAKTAMISLAGSETDSKLTNYAKKDASNITVSSWASKLGVGNVANGNSNLVTGGKVYTAVNDLKTSLTNAINTAKASLTETINDNKVIAKQNYVELPNGIIIQWGNVREPRNRHCPTTTFNFPTPFSSAVYTICATGDLFDDYFDENTASEIAIQSFTKSSCTFQSESGGGKTIYWIAIGK